jgi:hypothetical protein
MSNAPGDGGISRKSEKSENKKYKSGGAALGVLDLCVDCTSAGRRKKEESEQVQDSTIILDSYFVNNISIL